MDDACPAHLKVLQHLICNVLFLHDGSTKCDPFQNSEGMLTECRAAGSSGVKGSDAMLSVQNKMDVKTRHTQVQFRFFLNLL